MRGWGIFIWQGISCLSFWKRWRRIRGCLRWGRWMKRWKVKNRREGRILIWGHPLMEERRRSWIRVKSFNFPLHKTILKLLQKVINKNKTLSSLLLKKTTQLSLQEQTAKTIQTFINKPNKNKNLPLHIYTTIMQKQIMNTPCHKSNKTRLKKYKKVQYLF